MWELINKSSHIVLNLKGDIKMRDFGNELEMSLENLVSFRGVDDSNELLKDGLTSTQLEFMKLKIVKTSNKEIENKTGIKAWYHPKLTRIIKNRIHQIIIRSSKDY